jgi:hypothetical protein
LSLLFSDACSRDADEREEGARVGVGEQQPSLSDAEETRDRVRVGGCTVGGTTWG